jgi:hypothetical protein
MSASGERLVSKPLSSYTYEVTFGAGSLGINLQTTKSKKGAPPLTHSLTHSYLQSLIHSLTHLFAMCIGAYVDTFFRPKNNSILPAEQSGYITLG